MSQSRRGAGYKHSPRGRYNGEYAGASSINRYTPLSPGANPSRVDMTMRQLGAQQTPQGMWYGLNGAGYQTAVSELTGKGVTAADASQLLDKVYLSKDERSVAGYSNYNGAQATNPAHLGMYSPVGPMSAGTVPRTGDVALTPDQSAVLHALEASTPENYPSLKTSSSYLDESDVRRIAEALGLSTDGNRVALVAAIKNRVGAMSPRSQAQFYSRAGVSPSRSRSPSPRVQRF